MITASQLERTRDWVGRFRQIYLQETPLQIHSHEIDGGGAPEWTPEFRRVITGRDHDTLRLRRAMKRLRRRSLREWEVAYQCLVQGRSPEAITIWLNERSLLNGRTERYSVAGTIVVLFAAIDKLYQWY